MVADPKLLLVLTHLLRSVASLPVAVPAPFPGGIGPDGTRYKTEYRCEEETLELTCPPDHRIKIVRANFGRFSIAICNRHGDMDMSVNCMAPSSTRVMKKRCDSLDKCSIAINSNLFGDPCPGTPKYLEVHYGCVPTTTTTTKKPLPPWFLEGGGDSLWDSRIPDPPEGFAEVKASGDDATQQRIPITTPTPASSTTTSKPTPTTTTTTTLAPSSARQEATEEVPEATESLGLEYFPLTPEDNEVEVKILDIPLSDQPLHCPPTIARNLHWNWTAAGETSIQPCPPGSTGLARWSCGALEKPLEPVVWGTPQPDMGDCKTLAMSRLEVKVQSGELENVISSSLAHLTRVESLYGGDIEQSAAVMRTLANRIQYLLQTQGDTFYNKGIYIQEVLLNMVRAASNLLDLSSTPAWRDLSSTRQVKAANSILQALEENSFLFAEVTNKEEILMETAKNLDMSVTIQDVGRLSNGTVLGRSNGDESENSVLIPFNVLWDQSRSGIIKLVYFSFSTVHELLGSANIVVSGDEEEPEQNLKLNSRLVSASFGRTRRIEFPDAVEVSLHHLEPLDPLETPTCVSWNHELGYWSDSGCILVESTASASTCRCDHMALYGLVSRAFPSGRDTPGFSIVTLQIVTYIVAAISIVCVVLILVKFRRGLVRFVCKVSQSSEKHVCNPKTENNGLNSEPCSTLHSNLQHTLTSTTKGPEFLVQGQDGSITILPNLYQTNLDTGAPVMVTLNPYSSQLVDNLNRMMKEGEEGVEPPVMNPQLARLTATLRKKRCELGHPGPCRKTCAVNIHENALHLVDRGSVIRDVINPGDVVFRAVSPHGHVYWEINPTKDQTKPKSANSSGDENTNSDLQNVSDFSDDDHRAHSEMSRQSSSRFSESRPLIYTTSSASTSPGGGGGEFVRHAPVDLARHAHVNEGGQFSSGQRGRFNRGAGAGGRWPTLPPSYHEEVYAYAATDFSNVAPVPEQVQAQVQIKDLRTVPVSVKSKEYIMAKIADYTERNANNV